jgi:hypothetical protein
MRRFGLFGAVLLVLAAVYVAAWRIQPSRTSARPSSPPTAAVTAVTRSCPPPAPHAGQAHIALMSMPSGSAAVKSGTGTAALTAVPAVPAASSASKQAAAARPVTVSTPGALVTVTAPAAAGLGGTAVAATGPMAAGFEAEQLDASGTGVVACTHPGSDMWFVGTGTDDGAPQVRLYLMNTGDLPASVNVAILTDAGLQSGLNTGITVAPHQFAAENIAPLVHGSVALALHVQTSSGQVAAAAWESGSSGGAWLPQAAGPATSLVIPGLTVASSAARLFLTVPGSTDARVKVVAFTAQGKFPQFGSVPVDAPASATSSFPLTSLGASAAGLQLTSTVPIVAGILIPGQGIGSFTTAVAPVTEQGVVAGNPAARGLTVGLVLTAPAATARASIAVIGAGAGSGPATAGGQQVTTVKAGHTLAVTVPRPPGRQPFAVVITPLAGSGPIYAARVVTTGGGGLSAPLASLLPVPSALTVITLSPARNSYSAVLP